MQLDQRLLDELIANPNADLELFKFYRKHTLTSSSNFQGQFALHSCELGQKQSSNKSYFGYATSEKIITRDAGLHESVRLTPQQISEIQNLYFVANFDFKSFQDAVLRRGICWWTQLTGSIRVGESRPSNKPSSYTQFENALLGLSPSLLNQVCS